MVVVNTEEGKSVAQPGGMSLREARVFQEAEEGWSGS